MELLEIEHFLRGLASLWKHPDTPDLDIPEGLPGDLHDLLGPMLFRRDLWRRSAFRGSALEHAWVVDRRSLLLAWILHLAHTQVLFQTHQDQGPGATLCEIPPPPVDSAVSRRIGMFGGLLYEQTSLEAIHSLRACHYRPLTVLPGAVFMEQGSENGAFAQPHSKFDATTDLVHPQPVHVGIPELEELVRGEAGSQDNLGYLGRHLQRGNDPKALLAHVPVQLLKLMAFPRSQIVQELGLRDHPPVHLVASKLEAVTPGPRKGWERDLLVQQKQRARDTPVTKPIVLFRLPEAHRKAGRSQWFIFDGCHRAVAMVSAFTDSPVASVPVVFVTSGSRSDPAATWHDTLLPSAQQDADYEPLFAGRGSAGLVAHAYGASAKQNADAFIAAFEATATYPYGTRQAHEAPMEGPAPHLLHAAKQGWVRLNRFEGIISFLRLPSQEPAGEPRPLTICFAGYNSLEPPADAFHGDPTLWISTGIRRGGTRPTYGATFAEPHARQQMRAAHLGCPQLAALESIFTANPQLRTLARARIAESFGESVADQAWVSMGAPCTRFRPGYPLIHALPADMFFLRHIFYLAWGLIRAGLSPSLRLIGQSAGTHSALALWTHMHDLRHDLGMHHEQIHVREVTLVGAAAPIPYWQFALAGQNLETLRLIQAPGDTLCPLDLVLLREIAPDLRVLRVIPPHPSFATAVLGRARHSYMQLAHCARLAQRIDTGDEELVLRQERQLPRTPGRILERLLRNGMVAHFQTLVAHLPSSGWSGARLQDFLEKQLTLLAKVQGLSDAAVRVSASLSELMCTDEARGLMHAEYLHEHQWPPVREALAWIEQLPQGDQIVDKRHRASPHIGATTSASPQGPPTLEEIAHAATQPREGRGLGRDAAKRQRSASGSSTPSSAQGPPTKGLPGYAAILGTAAHRSQLPPDSEYARFLQSTLLLTDFTMASEVIFAVGLSILQSLDSQCSELDDKLRSGNQYTFHNAHTRAWTHLQANSPHHGIGCALECPSLGFHLIISVQGDLLWTSCEDRPHKDRSPAVDPGKPPRPGDCLMLRTRHTLSTGDSPAVWAAYLVDATFPKEGADASSVLELAVQALPPCFASSAHWEPTRILVDDILVIPYSNTNTRLSLIDCLSHTGKARLTLATGLPSSPCVSAVMNGPAAISPRLAGGFQSMITALKAVLRSGVDPASLLRASDQECTRLASTCPALRHIAEVAGPVGVKAVATRILPTLANFPAFLSACARDVLRGGRVCFVEGPPGAAKTDLVAIFCLWLFSFSELSIIVTNLQNTSNVAISEAFAKIAGPGTQFQDSWQLLLADGAFSAADKQAKLAKSTLRAQPPGAIGRMRKFVDSPIAVATIGKISVYARGHSLDHNYDIQVIDESQGTQGDMQAVATRAVRTDGLVVYIGDTKQVRQPPVRGLDPGHARNLEQAFRGGALHAALGLPIPLHRAAILDVAHRQPGIPAPDEHQASYEPAQEASGAAAASGETTTTGSGPPQEPVGRAGSPLVPPPPGLELATQGGDVDEHALDTLARRLRSQDDQPLYAFLLVSELDFLTDALPQPMTVAQAHGLDPQAGVSPFSLVFMNRLREPLATLVGSAWAYPPEPLSGSPRPCPPGPGLPRPLAKALPKPVLFVDVPHSAYSEEVREAYRIARAEGRPAPSNPEAVDIMFQAISFLAGHVPGIGTRTTGDTMRVRAMFAYRANQRALHLRIQEHDPDHSGTATHRLAPWPTTVKQMLDAGGKGPATTDGAGVDHDAPPREQTEQCLAPCVEVSTMVGALGATDGFAVAMFENNTRFMLNESMFLVAMSRSTQGLIIFGDFRFLAWDRGQSSAISRFLRTLDRIGCVVRPLQDIRAAAAPAGWVAEACRNVTRPCERFGGGDDKLGTAAMWASLQEHESRPPRSYAAARPATAAGGQPPLLPVRATPRALKDARFDRSQPAPLPAGRGPPVWQAIRETFAATEAVGDSDVDSVDAPLPRGGFTADTSRVYNTEDAIAALTAIRCDPFPQAHDIADAIFQIHPHKRWVEVWVGNVPWLASILARDAAGLRTERILAWLLHRAIWGDQGKGLWEAYGHKWALDLAELVDRQSAVHRVLDRWRSVDGILEFLTDEVSVIGAPRCVTVQRRAVKFRGPRADPHHKDFGSWRMVILTLPMPIAMDLARYLHLRQDSDPGHARHPRTDPSEPTDQDQVMTGIFATLGSPLGKALWPPHNRLPSELELPCQQEGLSARLAFQATRARQRLLGQVWPPVDDDRRHCQQRHFPSSSKGDDDWNKARDNALALSFSFIAARFLRLSLPASLLFEKGRISEQADAQLSPANSPWGPYLLATGDVGHDDTTVQLAASFLRGAPRNLRAWAPIRGPFWPWPARAEHTGGPLASRSGASLGNESGGAHGGPSPGIDEPGGGKSHAGPAGRARLRKGKKDYHPAPATNPGSRSRSRVPASSREQGAASSSAPIGSRSAAQVEYERAAQPALLLPARGHGHSTSATTDRGGASRGDGGPIGASPRVSLRSQAEVNRRRSHSRRRHHTTRRHSRSWSA